MLSESVGPQYLAYLSVTESGGVIDLEFGFDKQKKIIVSKRSTHPGRCMWGGRMAGGKISAKSGTWHIA